MKIKTILLGAAATLAFAPTAFAQRGADGQVNLLYWQAPSTLNPYLSSGNKDVHAASVVLEPLISFNADGEMVPRLAAELPTLDNGGISEDLKTVTWKLKEGLKWSDGSPMTSADVKFTADYCMHPEGGCAQAARFEGIESIETPDELTVVIHFTDPRPNPFTAFSGSQSPILQKAQFEPCLGTAASACTEANFGPIGTGAFRVSSFKTNDVVMYEANPEYRDPELPHFQTVMLKGGGDAAAAARAVLETGEFDYGWNLQLAPEVLASMAAAGKGELLVGFGTLVERIEINATDPSPSLPEGERSTVKHPHPILGDLRVRQALSMAIDRDLLTEIGYGETGQPTCNYVPAPAAFASDNTDCLKQDIEGAKALLEEAGWTLGGDGVRTKDGMRLSLVYQTSVNAVRQDFQALVKQWWQEIGVETELKAIDASVYFGGDAGSPDTFQKFYADVEMYANNFDGTDPEPYLAQRTCEKIPGPDNQWQGENINRFCNEEYDALIAELGATADLAKRAELAKRANDILTKETVSMIPLVYRGDVSARSLAVEGIGKMNSWDSELWNIAEWHRAK